MLCLLAILSLSFDWLKLQSLKTTRSKAHESVLLMRSQKVTSNSRGTLKSHRIRTTFLDNQGTSGQSIGTSSQYICTGGQYIGTRSQSVLPKCNWIEQQRRPVEHVSSCYFSSCYCPCTFDDVSFLLSHLNTFLIRSFRRSRSACFV